MAQQGGGGGKGGLQSSLNATRGKSLFYNRGQEPRGNKPYPGRVGALQRRLGRNK